MTGEFLKKYKYVLGVVGVILSLIVYKLRFLTLPYYWDEGWPYAVAVRTMQAHGISLVPGAISTFIARGHPLMFHFLGAAWMDAWGTSLISGHSFALFISVLLLLVIYRFGKTFFSERVGFIACLLFATQAIFIYQSVFLLPEMLLALCTMLCLFAFFKRNNFLFIFFGVCLLLTKESGIVLIISLGFSEILEYFCSQEKNKGYLIKRLLLIAIPVVIASIFFIIQKIKYGWFLYPFYTDYIKAGWSTAFDNIPTIVAYSFVYYGRNGISFFLIISLVILFVYKKVKFTRAEKIILSVLSYFILFFLFFSALNYYIPRYLLCIFPPFIIIAVQLIDKAFSAIQFRGKKVVYALLVTGIVITNVFYYVQNRNNDRDYSPSLNVAMQVIGYCEKEKLFNNYIFTTCVLRYDLNEPYAGFTSGSPFTHVEWEFSNKTQYCIFSKDEYDASLFDQIKKTHNLELIKRFDDGDAWTELYKVDNW